MTPNLSEVVDALKNQVIAFGYPENDVFIGDENLIPRTPAAAVIANSRTRELVETGHVTMNTFTVDVMLYHAELGAFNLNRFKSIQHAEALETHLHQDMTLGGLLFNSYCTAIEPGFSTREKQILVSTRIGWYGRSKTRI